MVKKLLMTSSAAVEVEELAAYTHAIYTCLEFAVSHFKSLSDEMKQELIDKLEEQMTGSNSFEISSDEETLYHITENFSVMLRDSSLENDNPIHQQANSVLDALHSLDEYQNSSGIAADIFSVIRKGICYGTIKNDYFLRCIWGLAKCKHNWKDDEEFGSFLSKFVVQIMYLEQTSKQG